MDRQENRRSTNAWREHQAQAPGCPWENGYQESFYSQFKVDLGDWSRFMSVGELVFVVYQTIYVYNNTRIHSALKMSPVQFAEKIAQRYNLGSKVGVL